MPNVTPIKVRIGLGNRGAIYPSFNSLPSVISSGKDWSVYVDQEGSGWLYDRCGHKDEEPGSPMGVQFGVLLVPNAFAVQAAAAFPDEVSILDEAELEDFYDNKHARDFDDEEIDLEVITKIKRKMDLGLTLTPHQQRAIDPNDDTPGIRKNYRKTWAEYKAKRGFTVKP